MHKAGILFVSVSIILLGNVFAQENVGKKPEPRQVDLDAIKQTALDYIEGWYDGNAERMEKSLHPELAKRIVFTNSKTGNSSLDQMGALNLVQGTRKGFGKQIQKDQQQKDVIILDLFENAASVKVIAATWIDYMHMAKFNGNWVIVNVLWELKPNKK